MGAENNIGKTPQDRTAQRREGRASEHIDSREVRLLHLSNLEAAGIDAYPAAPPLITHSNSDVLSDFDNIEGTEVGVVGRITAIRDHGKTVFYDIEDEHAKLQLHLAKQGEEDANFDLIKENYDTGDFVNAVGSVFKTRRGEITVKTDQLDMLSKAILPPPSERFGRLEPERARRQRYLELMANPEARERFNIRARMVQTMREEFNFANFTEHETPVLDTVYGGANANPFLTNMKALDGQEMFMRIANELYLKRLVTGNMGPVFEFSRNFRNEGIDRTHSPEFTAVEAYKPYSDYLQMMDLAENMFERIAISIHGKTEVQFGEHLIDFKAPWRRLTIYDGLREAYGIDPEHVTDDELAKLALEHGLDKKYKRRGDVLLALFEDHFDDKLIQPTFVMDYPRETSPLTKQHRDNPDLAERFECVIGGLEVMNCYTELNDPREQRRLFEEEAAKKSTGDMEAMPMDEDFLIAMSHGMPPMGGIGISIDRMAMILTNTEHIRDIILFPPNKRIR